MLASLLCALTLVAPTVVGAPNNSTGCSPLPSSTNSPTLTVASPSPSPSATEPPRAPPTVQRVWDTGFVDMASFIEGDYVDGWEYLEWAWALIYRPDNGGTFCLTTYSENTPAAMVAYLADSESNGAALIAGTWSDRTDAACVSGIGSGCIDMLAQWGNSTTAKKAVHCNHEQRA